MNYKKLSPSEKWIIKGVPWLFIIGSFMHFLYDLSGKSTIIGLFSAVNESIWEHTKMVLLPVICWWTIYYLIIGKKDNINKDKWFAGALMALLTSIITIPLLYYFYTQAFGVQLLAVDISILFLALLFGQLVGLHFYRYSKGVNSKIVLGIFGVLIIIFMVWTFYPPNVPLFKDGPTGTYGIKEIKP